MNCEFDSLARGSDAAEKFIGGLPPTERISIFSSSGRQSLDFTGDRQKLHDALFKLRPSSRANPRAHCPEITDYVASRIVNHGDRDAYAIVRDAAVNDCHKDPRIVTNEWISMESQSASGAYALQARHALVRLEDAIRNISMMPGERQVMLFCDGFMPLDMQALVERVIDRALHSRITISALDGKGLAVLLREADASRSHMPGGRLRALHHMFDTAREGAATGTLEEIAEGTGGRFFHDSNDLLEGFRTVLTPPEVSYVKTFSPPNLKFNGAFHNLKVRLTNGRGLSVQARRGYFEPRKGTTPEEEARDRIREAVLSQDEIRQLPLEVHTQFSKTGAEAALMTVIARLDIHTLQFQKEAELEDKHLTFVFALFDQDGKFLAGEQKDVTMELKDSTLTDPRKSEISIESHFPVKMGTCTVRVVVRHSEGGEMAALSEVLEIPFWP